MNSQKNKRVSENIHKDMTEYAQAFLLSYFDKQCNYIGHCLKHHGDDAGAIIHTLAKIGYLGDMDKIRGMIDMKKLILENEMCIDLFIYDEIYTFLTIHQKSLESEFQDQGYPILYDKKRLLFENTSQGIKLNKDAIFTRIIEEKIKEKIVKLIDHMKQFILTNDESQKTQDILEDPK